jgi:hypothetical protein
VPPVKEGLSSETAGRLLPEVPSHYQQLSPAGLLEAERTGRRLFVRGIEPGPAMAGRIFRGAEARAGPGGLAAMYGRADRCQAGHATTDAVQIRRSHHAPSGP